MSTKRLIDFIPDLHKRSLSHCGDNSLPLTDDHGNLIHEDGSHESGDKDDHH